jgi:hypothetical protein
MREYGNRGPAVGVWGRTWVRGFTEAEPYREFDSEDEAVAAFDAMELAELKAGNGITDFRLYHSDP